MNLNPKSPPRSTVLTSQRSNAPTSPRSNVLTPQRFNVLTFQRSNARAPRARGVALVITLILLSIITFMAVTFLVVSTAERRSVSNETDQNVALEAAKGAADRAIAELLNRIVASNNPDINELLVSTNFSNDNGYFAKPANLVTNLTNVNLLWKNDGSAFSSGDWQQAIANLYYNPRVPVFMTNRLTGSNEFRFYFDLNRNGRFEDTGLVPVQDENGNYYDTTQAKWVPAMKAGDSYLSNYFVGDPQWIGLLERAGLPHSSSNYFTSRLAYVVVPANKTLDINYIHNDASYAQLSAAMANGTDGFRRDQGVGTYEINLAAFLADLNTNAWFPSANGLRYLYRNTNDPSQGDALNNQGVAFNDALSLLRYRYDSYVPNLQSPATMYNGAAAFSADDVDSCLYGPLMIGTSWSGVPDYDTLVTNKPWPGSDNPKHFFSMQELFNKAETAIGITDTNNPTDRLLSLGTNLSTYDRYTFYRLMAQLGTDTPVEPASKLNLNYDNLVYVNPTNGIRSATNFHSWAPADFFVNASYRLLTNAGYTFPLLSNLSGYTAKSRLPTNGIMVWPTNLYTPSVHRLFQLAANIYDATTNRTLLSLGYPAALTNGMGFPTVFRPVFNRYGTGTNAPIFIVGYMELTNDNLALSILSGASGARTFFDPNNPADLFGFQSTLSNNPPPMLYGFPLVIGAKTGWPNFNEFALETDVQASRKLQFTNTGSSLLTNQMYFLAISNTVGAQGWNSYAINLNRPLMVIAVAKVAVSITNENGYQVLNGVYCATNASWGTTNYAAFNGWPGFQGTTVGNNLPTNFVTPLLTNFSAFNGTGSEYRFSQPPPGFAGTLPGFVGITGLFETLSGGTTFPVPHWFLNMNTKVQFAIVDPVAGRIVDFANLDSVQDPASSTVDLAAELAPANYCEGTSATAASMWCTNLSGGFGTPPLGVLNQIGVSEGRLGYPGSVGLAQWSTQFGDVIWSINFFRTQFQLSPLPGATATAPYVVTNMFYAPYVPTRTVSLCTRWQACDPLVHYTIPDLKDLVQSQSQTATNSTAQYIWVDSLPNPSPLVDFQRAGNGYPAGGPTTRYRPWGAVNKGAWTDPVKAPDPFGLSVNIAVKDPVPTEWPGHPDSVGRSDDWVFPTNKLPSIGFLGRVHRGTPWQTVYLKSGVVDGTNLFSVPYGQTTSLWTMWTGDNLMVTNFGQISTNIVPLWRGGTNQAGITNDSIFSHPITDRGIFDLFSAALNDNSTRGRLSVNQTNLAAWSAVLSGVNVLTNWPASGVVHWTNIQPVGVYNSFDLNPADLPPALQIVNAINNVRRTNFPNSTFYRLGDILATPELTVNPYTNQVWSSYLNTSVQAWSPYFNMNALYGGAASNLTDEVVERIPQQVLGLLQCEPPRFVIYAYGQALKPADQGLVTSGPFFGLCTNYQVTAEAATRTVLHLEGALTGNPQIIIDSFNVLPPE
jgi:hypothetical protein